MEKVRVRFAPSPTGPLHLGGVRTALYDYLFAKHNGGDFILRIEDTDTQRYVPGSEEYIMEALEWIGMVPDESPKHGGPYAPYRQSERRDIYDRYTEQILKTDYAYLAFDTPEELDQIRAEFEARGEVLVKNDGMPTYHFANIIDDHDMKITHVIRGEEWLPSMALHVLLYEAMGWDAPEFAHLSLILKPEGKGKLSKRDGDKFGFPVFPLNFTDPATGNTSAGYREEGYLPEAFINMVAMLGWSPADNKEIVSMDEMIKEFDLNKVHKAGARFSAEKAKWFNQQYLQLMSNEAILPEFKKVLAENNIEVSDEKALKIIGLMKERATFVKDIYNDGKFFFHAPESFDEKASKKAWSPETAVLMQELIGAISSVDFKADTIKESIHHLAEAKGLGMGKVMMPLRLSLVGELKGPDVPDLMEMIGKEETISRITKAIETLK